MTFWALLLLASALLATPGLTFSGLIPEDHDLDTANMCQDEKFFQMLAQDIPQGDRWHLKCMTCKKIIKVLRKALGHDITRETIKHALSLVCRKILGNKKQCQELITKYDNKITQSIMNGKSSKEICVQLRMCPPTIGR
ncbi:antimicrobial peptide NK-lysin-like [Hyaena hyaena]|uniref:antimicrobial peptide NK-lysin-like n=1 Tax=Hyaena hyaena TaxID=95912 RepID=UPI0019221CF9|nr:antimicrobial peptide NK-lysin-like [Hyaena hyaena]